MPIFLSSKTEQVVHDIQTDSKQHPLSEVVSESRKIEAFSLPEDSHTEKDKKK